MTDISQPEPKNAFALAAKDMLRSEFIFLSLAPFAVVVFLGIGLTFLLGMETTSYVSMEMHELQHQHSDSEWINTLFGLLASSYLIGFASIVIYALFGGIVILFFNSLATIVAGLLAPFIVKMVQQEHYPSFTGGNDISALAAFIAMLQAAAIMILLLIFLLPLYLIPFLGFFVIYMPFWYFFHKTILLDTWSHIPGWKTLYRQNRASTRIMTLIMFTAAAFLPIIGVFLQIYFFTAMTHYGMLLHEAGTPLASPKKEEPIILDYRPDSPRSHE